MLPNKKFLIFILVVLVLTVFSGCSETADSDLDIGEPISQYNGESESDALNDAQADFNDFSGADGNMEIEITESEIPLALWEIDEIDADEYASEVLRLINIERQNAGLSDLYTTEALTNTAVVRAKELATLFSHTRPDGSSCFTAYKENDISYSAAAENIASGQRTPEAVLASWMNSPGHKANILNSDFGHLGLGIEIDSDGTIYWSLNFTD